MERDYSVRKKICGIFNKTLADFPSAYLHKNYEEEVEDLIYKVTNRIDFDETNRFIEEYRTSNVKTITLNQFKKAEEIKMEKYSITSDVEQRAVKLQQYQVIVFPVFILPELICFIAELIQK